MIHFIVVCNIEHVKISWFGLDLDIGENNVGFVTETFFFFYLIFLCTFVKFTILFIFLFF